MPPKRRGPLQLVQGEVDEIKKQVRHELCFSVSRGDAEKTQMAG